MRHPHGKAGSTLVAFVASAAVAMFAARSDANGSMPVVVSQLGPKDVQVEVAAGQVGPCDSGSNRPLFKGWVPAGQTLTIASPYGCVCYRQTYEDFPEVNWSPSTVTCRPLCAARGPVYCPADPADQIFIRIQSKPPP